LTWFSIVSSIFLLLTLTIYVAGSSTGRESRSGIGQWGHIGMRRVRDSLAQLTLEGEFPAR